MGKRALHVVTNPGHHDDPDRKTGLWLSKRSHGWDIFAAEGHAQDIVTPDGGRLPSRASDPDSVAPQAFSAACLSIWGERSSRLAPAASLHHALFLRDGVWSRMWPLRPSG